MVYFSVEILSCFLVTRHENTFPHLFHKDTYKRLTDVLFFFRSIYLPVHSKVRRVNTNLLQTEAVIDVLFVVILPLR